jgi:putative thiamine transport system ATP-binding protein
LPRSQHPAAKSALAQGAKKLKALEVNVSSLRTPSQVLVQNLTLRVPPGAIHTVMGASGSGKSSLLGAVCGTLGATMVFDGVVSLNGQRIDRLPTEQRKVGILFQDDLLFAHMTVRENLLFAVPAASGAQRQHREDKVRQGLFDLEMEDFAEADPATLSGGQRARVSLMRALLAEPLALLLDEPFSKLDMALRERLRRFVFDRVTRREIPVLLVTHDDADIFDSSRVTRLQPLVQPPTAQAS